MPAPITRLCPAKLNLALSVGPAEGPRGYHPIASWMVALDWGDELTLARLDDGASEFQIAFADDAPQPQAVDWPLERDLAWRAHALLEQRCGRPLPVRAALRKRIPAGAGLGGGSSDAAAMLLGLNELFDLRLGANELADTSRALGSDVAFLVVAGAGQPGAVVTGFGETLSPLPRRVPIHAAVFMPALRCATADVYRAFDAVKGAALDEGRVRDLVSAAALEATLLFNDLFDAAMKVAPALASLHGRLREALGVAVHLTGSGAAMFALASDADAAEALAAEATARCGVPGVAVRSL